MNDPWDVKSVRQSGQYLSCLKINGVPLLPPVLSKECRKEMQYYKLLAKEVEKRISQLKPFVVTSDTDSSDDKTDAPELPESEQGYELVDDVQIEKITAIKSIDHSGSPKLSPDCTEVTKISNFTVDSDSSSKNTSKFIVDLSLSINETGKSILDVKSTLNYPAPVELPERDCEVSPKTDLKRPNSIDLNAKAEAKGLIEDKLNFSVNTTRDSPIDPITNLSPDHDAPSSLSSKSFTRSLNNIHTESVKDLKTIPLIRQRSYTLLQPCAPLLAHLEVQSLNTGVEITSISMSDSLSNISSMNKKRRSWDLESAKVKWSSMALELKQKNVANGSKPNGITKNQVSKPATRKPQQSTPPRARSVTQERPKRVIPTPKALNKSEPVQKAKKTLSPVRNTTNKNTVKSPPVTSPQPEQASQNLEQPLNVQLISESDDPAARVRELYEKIQKQQLIQMANLVEKQKREQMLLQQVFEEQNNLLFTQLKTICPKSPNEIKEAWSDIKEPADRGPVSLSQLINHKPPERSPFESPVTSTLTETHNYINQCEDVLKKSREARTGSIKKPQQIHSQAPRENTPSPKSQSDPSKTRTHTPTLRNTSTSRKLTYESSLSSDRDYDPILTDRTNDTMADLNVTFPSDHSEDCQPYSQNGEVNMCVQEVAIVCRTSVPKRVQSRPNDRMTTSVEDKPNSMNNAHIYATRHQVFRPPTAQECAAACTIVAYAKGYLVRRLMRTERVQSTVQTIKDALLCALQLHQDREGIRGADVDLHRRLIQQITAACYALHDTFVASTPAERCAMIAADRDRSRRRSLTMRLPTRQYRPTDIMSQSHSGAFPTRAKRSPTSLMTQSHHESYSGEKWGVRARRRPWR